MRRHQGIARRLLLFFCCTVTVFLFLFLSPKQQPTQTVSHFEKHSESQDSFSNSAVASILTKLDFNPFIPVPDSILKSSFSTPPPLGTCNFITLSQKESWYDDELGSALFRYASLYGIANTNGKTPFIYSSFPLYNYFNLSIIPKEPNSIDEYQILPESTGCCSYQSPIRKCESNVSLNGFRRSWRYFHRYRLELKNEFRLINDLKKSCESNLTELFQQYEIDASKCLLIGVHGRIGEFWSTPNGSGKIIQSNTVRYLKRAMRRLREEFQDDYSCFIYLITGNDYGWLVKSLIEERDVLEEDPGLLILYKTDDPLVDLCILTNTNHTIFTFGTLGWWAAYLTGGLAIYQKEYADILEKKEYNIQDYFLPEWIAL